MNSMLKWPYDKNPKRKVKCRKCHKYHLAGHPCKT